MKAVADTLGVARSNLAERAKVLPSKSPSSRGPYAKAADEAVPSLPPEPLSAETTAFWNGSALSDELFGEVRTPPVSAALLKRLGKFPFWRGAESLAEALEPIYAQASSHGLDVFVGAGASAPER